MTEKRIPDPRAAFANSGKIGPDLSKVRCERPLLDPIEALRIKDEKEAETLKSWSAIMGSD